MGVACIVTPDTLLRWYRNLSEFLIHYHTERNHQGLDNELLTPLPANTNADGSIQRRERLGGILNHYYRDAA
jgi:putative transposase